MTWRPKETIGHFLIRSSKMLMRLGDIRLKALGASAGQIPVFAALKDGGELTQMALARFAQIEQPTMAATIARMERDGLVERKSDPDDGRSSLIRLTPAAVARLPAMIEALSIGNEEAMEGFDEAERALLAGMLRRIIANLEKALEKGDGGQVVP